MSARDRYPSLAWLAGERDEPDVDHGQAAIYALEEIDGWKGLWHAIGRPGRAGDFLWRGCLDEFNRLHAEVDELREANDRLRKALLEYQPIGRSAR